MPTEKKNAEILELRKRVDGAASMFFTDYRGLTVGELRTLRNELRKDAASYSVVKNALFGIAVGDERRAQLKDVLAGPTAVAFVTTDPVAAAKALAKFASDSKKLQIKAALVDGRFLGAGDVDTLAKIRSRRELHGALVGSLKSPLYRLHGTLHAGISKLVRTLHALHEQRSESQPAA
ncbi:MAG TPA: 50S ribosomal protein L10 [Candidatus Eremiobacteraceae bacterium]|nr:50S ribosomal protein L10 [Candidatus Eremiobacteraceae bacterium]